MNMPTPGRPAQSLCSRVMSAIARSLGRRSVNSARAAEPAGAVTPLTTLEALELLCERLGRPAPREHLIAALPVAGVDGTARKRLAGSPARGQAHIKTGTLNGVRAIGGYLLDHAGRRHALVMMINHPQAAAGQAAQDALLEWVWAGMP